MPNPNPIVAPDQKGMKRKSRRAPGPLPPPPPGGSMPIFLDPKGVRRGGGQAVPPGSGGTAPVIADRFSPQFPGGGPRGGVMSRGPMPMRETAMMAPDGTGARMPIGAADMRPNQITRFPGMPPSGDGLGPILMAAGVQPQYNMDEEFINPAIFNGMPGMYGF